MINMVVKMIVIRMKMMSNFMNVDIFVWCKVMFLVGVEVLGFLFFLVVKDKFLRYFFVFWFILLSGLYRGKYLLLS